MDFGFSPEQEAIREGVAAVCRRFGDDYWRDCEAEARFPREFHQAMAAGGWLGITMPEEHGGAGLGVTEAAIMMHTVARHGGGMAAASSLHINMFGPHPIVVHGTPEQKARLHPAAGRGRGPGLLRRDRARCRARHHQHHHLRREGAGRLPRQRAQALDLHRPGGEPDPAAGPHHAEGGVRGARPTASRCSTPTLDRSKIEVQRIPKMGRDAVDSNAVFIDDLFIPEEDRIGEEGSGFSYLLDSLNPERVLVGGGGASASARTRSTAPPRYARERVVFGRPIGQNQGIQHPLAECWTDAGIRAADGDEGGLALRQRPALRRRGECREVARRPRRLRGLPAGGDDPWRHGLRQGIPWSSACCAR